MSGVQGDHPPAGVWGGVPNSCAAAQKRGSLLLDGERGDARCATREAAQAAGARTAGSERRDEPLLHI